MRVLLAVILLAMGADVSAQPGPCTAPEHRQFDFWVGDWRVTTPDGKHAGDNRIEKILDGCALHESWTGATGGRGFSYNAYDRDRKVWHQTWVDKQGTLLLLDGTFTNGGRVLCVCALGDSVAAAQRHAYEGVAKIRWDGVQYRKDIGFRAIARR